MGRRLEKLPAPGLECTILFDFACKIMNRCFALIELESRLEQKARVFDMTEEPPRIHTTPHVLKIAQVSGVYSGQQSAPKTT